MKNNFLGHAVIVAAVAMLGSVTTANAGYAVAGNNSASVIYSGTKYTPIPKFLTKEKAIEMQQRTGAQVRVAYNIDEGKTTTLNQAQGSEFFYYNTYTNIISVANTSQDAIDLSELQPQVFFAVSGETLSETIKRWAEQSGYSISWNMDNDYRIQYSYTFYGQFAAKSGPLNQVLKSFEHGSHAMRAKIMANKVIVIQPNQYVPAAVIGV